MPSLKPIQDLSLQLRRLPFLTQIHALLRLQSFPFTTVASLIPAHGNMLDFGAGFGFFSFIVAKRYPRRRIVAYDVSPAKTAVAKKLLDHYPHVTVSHSWARVKRLKPHVVVILDVLYLLSARNKQVVLKQLFSLLKLNGILLWSIVPKEFSWRFYLAWFQEWLMVRVFQLTKTTDTILDFETVPWAKATLKEIGFTRITVHHLPTRLPFFHRHLLLVARKPKLKG